MQDIIAYLCIKPNNKRNLREIAVFVLVLCSCWTSNL